MNQFFDFDDQNCVITRTNSAEDHRSTSTSTSRLFTSFSFSNSCSLMMRLEASRDLKIKPTVQNMCFETNSS